MGKRTAQKDAIKDITSDNQVNINFPYWWSPTRQTFLPIFIFIFNKKNDKLTLHITSKITKEPKKKSRLGTASNKITGGGGALTSLQSTNHRPWFCLGSLDKTISTKEFHCKTRTRTFKKTSILPSFYFYCEAQQRAKWAAIRRPQS